MATVWYDHYAGCPFYQRTDANKQVYCEGICGAKSTIMKYDTKEEMMVQLKTVCCDNYESCVFYQFKEEMYDKNG